MLPRALEKQIIFSLVFIKWWIPTAFEVWFLGVGPGTYHKLKYYIFTVCAKNRYTYSKKVTNLLYPHDTGILSRNTFKNRNVSAKLSTYIFRHLRQKRWPQVMVTQALIGISRQIPQTKLSLTAARRTL
jgi:hypothetical protein